MTAAGKVISTPPGAGARYRIGADRFEVKGETPTGDEGFSVIEYEGAPHLPGPPSHLHRTFDEGWYILQGTVEFSSGSEVTRAAAGSYLFVPRGTPHTFRVVGDVAARWVGIFSPGRYVALLEELGPLIPAAGPPDPRKIQALFRRYDTEFA